MLFQKLLFPLSLNGLQLKALVMRYPIIHQQNLHYEENMLNFVLLCWLSNIIFGNSL
jgi:hypothetical protein